MVLGKAKFCICILLLRLQNHKCESPVSNTVFKIQSFYSDSELYLCRSFFRASTWHYHIHPVSHTTLPLLAALYFWCKLHFLYRHQICRHGKNQFQLFYAYVLQNSKVWYISKTEKNQPEIWFLSCAKASKKMCQCHLRNHFSLPFSIQKSFAINLNWHWLNLPLHSDCVMSFKKKGQMRGQRESCYGVNGDSDSRWSNKTYCGSPWKWLVVAGVEQQTLTKKSQSGTKTGKMAFNQAKEGGELSRKKIT